MKTSAQCIADPIPGGIDGEIYDNPDHERGLPWSDVVRVRVEAWGPRRYQRTVALGPGMRRDDGGGERPEGNGLGRGSPTSAARVTRR